MRHVIGRSFLVTALLAGWASSAGKGWAQVSGPVNDDGQETALRTVSLALIALDDWAAFGK